MGQSRPLFVYFHYFLDTISIIQIEKSIEGVLGIGTRGHRMVGADKTTELWRPPYKLIVATGFGKVVQNPINHQIWTHCSPTLRFKYRVNF